MNGLPASPHCGEFEYIIMVASDRRDVWWATPDDEVDTDRAHRLDRDKNSRIAAHHSPRNKRDCAAAGVCAKGIKKEPNTLDEADFVRDVANRDYHYQSHPEIGGAKRIYQHLSAPEHLGRSRSAY